MAFNFLDKILPVGVDSSKLVCLYQFDFPATGFNDRSGNGHDLTQYGTHLFSRSRQGEGIWQNYTSGYAYTGIDPAAFTELGALTVEWIACKWVYASTLEYLFFIGAGSGEAEEDNSCVGLRTPALGNPQTIEIFHEYGAGLDVTLQSQWGIPFGGLHHGALTRASDGVTYKYYSDGELLEEMIASQPPTGGTGDVRLYIQGVNTSSEGYHLLNSFRYCKGVEFTLEQIQESYNRFHV